MDKLANEFMKLNESYRFYCSKLADLNGLLPKNTSITVNSSLFKIDIEEGEFRDRALAVVGEYLAKKITEIQKELSKFKLVKND